MQSNNLIELTDVSAGYEGRNIVSGITMSIAENRFVALVGPNGGGKTTIVRTLLGQLRPTHGHIERREGLRIGYMPQVLTIDLDFPINVREVIGMGYMAGGLFERFGSQKKRNEKIDELIEFARLGAVADQRIGQLSGGQRQRVILCRALMMNPELLVLDEPVTYMDRNSETTLYRLLPQLTSRMAIVIVSHDTENIVDMANSIIHVDGTIRQIDNLR